MNIDIRHGNALELLQSLPDDSVHFVLTDPPYFIDGMGEDWDNANLQRKAAKAGVIGSMPVGMKCDPAQGRTFQQFMDPVCEQIFRVLKPGGFCDLQSARLWPVSGRSRRRWFRDSGHARLDYEVKPRHSASRTLCGG